MKNGLTLTSENRISVDCKKNIPGGTLVASKCVRNHKNDPHKHVVKYMHTQRETGKSVYIYLSWSWSCCYLICSNKNANR